MAEKQSNEQKRLRKEIVEARQRLTEHNEPVDFFRSGRQELNTNTADELDREELIGGMRARR